MRLIEVVLDILRAVGCRKTSTLGREDRKLWTFWPLVNHYIVAQTALYACHREQTRSARANDVRLVEQCSLSI